MILLPLVLRYLTVAEVGIWLLLSSVSSLQILFDIGFSQTFTRAISNLRGGARIEDLGFTQSRPSETGESTLEHSLLRVYGTLRRVYVAVAFLCLLLLALASVVIIQPSRRLEDPSVAWIAWGIVAISTSICVWGNGFTSTLLGMEKIATLRRWETLFGILAMLAASLVVVVGGGLLSLVITQQFFSVGSVVRNRVLCMRDTSFRNSNNLPADRQVIKVLWPAAWRSGIGVMSSFGIIQASGFVVSNLATATELATYLLGLRLITTVSQVSQAPFYSKLPTLSRLFASGEQTLLLSIAKRGMVISHCCFLVAFLAAGLFAQPLLLRLGSSTKFPTHEMWAMFGLAFFFERFGAMHLQLYSITNHIIWHIANGLTGTALIITSWAAYQQIGLLGFPIGMTLSYLFVYCTISVSHSYNQFNLRLLEFDRLTCVVFLCIVGYALNALCYDSIIGT